MPVKEKTTEIETDADPRVTAVNIEMRLEALRMADHFELALAKEGRLHEKAKTEPTDVVARAEVYYGFIMGTITGPAANT